MKTWCETKRKILSKKKRNEAKNLFFSFAKRSVKEAKRFLFRFDAKKKKRKWYTLIVTLLWNMQHTEVIYFTIYTVHSSTVQYSIIKNEIGKLYKNNVTSLCQPHFFANDIPKYPITYYSLHIFRYFSTGWYATSEDAIKIKFSSSPLSIFSLSNFHFYFKIRF